MAYLFLGASAFLVADNHDRSAIKPGNASDNCQIVGKQPVSVQLIKICKYVLNKIQRCKVAEGVSRPVKSAMN